MKTREDLSVAVNVYNPSPEMAEADQIGLQNAYLPNLKKIYIYKR